MKKRDDLFAKVDKEIDSLLNGSAHNTPASEGHSNGSSPSADSPLAVFAAKIASPQLNYADQTTLVRDLKKLLKQPQYDAEARKLLIRLSQHPTLNPLIRRDIQAALEVKPTPEPVKEAAVAEKPTLQKSGTLIPLPTFQPGASETILKELNITFHGGGLVGMATGLFTVGWVSAAAIAARKASQVKLVVTDQRLVFLIGGIEPKILDVPLDEIQEIKKTSILLDPALDIITKSGQQHIFSIIAVGGAAFGNREDFIKLVMGLKQNQL